MSLYNKFLQAKLNLNEGVPLEPEVFLPPRGKHCKHVVNI